MTFDPELALWHNLPRLAEHYLAKAAEPYHRLRRLLGDEPAVVWYDPDAGEVHCESGDVATKLAAAGWRACHARGQLDPDRPWMPIKSAGWPAPSFFKPLAQITNLAPAPWNKPFGGATPLAAMLGGGALGAGVGYLGGAALEHLLPEDVVRRGRLRRTLAVLGGVGGAVPGAYLGVVGQRNWDDPSRSSWNAWASPNVLMGSEKAGAAVDPIALAASLLDEVADHDPVDPLVKEAWQGGAGALFLPSIPVDAFNRVVLSDPFAPPPLQAATIGLAGAADASRGGTGIVSPYDIARVGLGMGAGLVQAYLGGKVLGQLAGLTPEAQKTLQQAGMFAGALKAVVPGMFGGS